MIRKTPIKCPNCGRVVAYAEDLEFAYLPEGLRCPYRGAEVIPPSEPIW